MPTIFTELLSEDCVILLAITWIFETTSLKSFSSVSSEYKIGLAVHIFLHWLYFYKIYISLLWKIVFAIMTFYFPTNTIKRYLFGCHLLVPQLETLTNTNLSVCQFIRIWKAGGLNPTKLYAKRNKKYLTKLCACCRWWMWELQLQKWGSLESWIKSFGAWRILKP